MSRRTPLSSVAVVGSLNVDLIASVDQLPRHGQTVSSSKLRKLFGGKGANQAIAAACHQAEVRMIGCVGGDADGRAYIARMEAFGIDPTGIAIAPKSLTGTALIGVAKDGENLIMVAAEANGRLTPSWIHRHSQQITTARALLLQWEVPMPAVLTAIRLANKAGVPVIMNPSPLSEDFPWGEVRIDYLIVNEGEAESIFHLDPERLPTQVSRWHKALAKLGVGTVIVTRGSRSTLALSRSEMIEVPATQVTPVDTVGAGDCFAGTFAASLAKGAALAECIRSANKAAARSTLKPGAQPEPRKTKQRS